MSVTVAHFAARDARAAITTPPAPPSERAAWAAMSALLRMLDLADRVRTAEEGTPIHAAFSEQLEGARRAAIKACDNFVGAV
jgi:hypothetical protein